jgi:excisionase family DNA binding protein
MANDVEPFVRIQEAAGFLGVRVSWLYEMVRLNKVPSYKIGAFRRFKLKELDAWVKANGNHADLLSGQQGGGAVEP